MIFLNFFLLYRNFTAYFLSNTVHAIQKIVTSNIIEHRFALTMIYYFLLLYDLSVIIVCNTT